MANIWSGLCAVMLMGTTGAAAAQAPEPEAQVAPVEAQPAATETIAVPAKQEDAAQAAPAADDKPGTTRLDSVMVTADYRQQGVQDVVGSAQAFDGMALDKSGAAGMQDYLLQVPSVSLQPSGNGKLNIAMRGVSNINASDLGFNAGSPTVGVYLNDVAIQGSGVFPDLRIYDLDRIEVLKGPQGTLYGEGSMGGAIKMVTTPADYNQWAGRGEVMYDWTADGKPGNELRGALNIPLIDDHLGARIVGTTRLDGGFVDYTKLNRPDANSVRSSSGRGLLSYKADSGATADYMFLYNSDKRDQFPVVDEGKQDDLTNSGPETQFANTKFTIHALTLKFDLGVADLSSISAYYDTDRSSQRRTTFLQALVQTQFEQAGLPAPVIFPNAPSYIATELNSFSQELRLVSKGEHALDWIAGVFLRARKQNFELLEYENTLPEPAVLQQLFGTLNLSSFNLLSNLQEDSRGYEQFRQASAYGELTWHIVPEKLELTGGLRYFNENFDYHNYTVYYGVQSLLIAGTPSNIHPDGTVSNGLDTTLPASGFLPKLSLGWHITDGDMVYSSISRGFRSATPNTQSQLGDGPATVRPDYVWNAEVGYKGAWLDGSLLTNFSAYDIEWQDIQGTLVGTATLAGVPVDFPYLANAGDARILGAEAQTTWAPLSFMTLNLNGGYTHAELIKPGETSQAVKGSELPNSPRWTGSFAMTFTQPLWDAWNGDATLGYTYTGEQNTSFTIRTKDKLGRERIGGSSPVPAYALLKASIGVSDGRLRVQLFGDNLTNEHAVIGASVPIPQYTVVTPRVVGIRMGYEFQ